MYDKKTFYDAETTLVFDMLETLAFDLTNRMLLASFQENQEMYLSSKLKKVEFNYFSQYNYLYWFISEGEFLSLPNLSQNEEIIGIRKSQSLDGTHEIVVYKPSQQN